ncbi:MAG: M81 family metallopeptidase [Alphaproteobacteria bacterium]|nr:M81 family metallopeptidase [Alphaproteobacteria bacterium]
MTRAPRIAVGGFMLESNSHAPVATRAEFESVVLLSGDALLADLRAATPRSPRTITGFTRAMDEAGAWMPLPTLLAVVGASGSCEQGFFEWCVDELCARLRAALPLDGVFLSQHGAADAVGDADPDGTVFRRVREVVGPDVPVVATLDLHANMSEAMVRYSDVLVSYRTNPHVDMWERGQDCARHLRAMLRGLRTHAAYRKLPLAPPSVTQSTAPGTPYADIIRFGQERVRDGVIDVSVMSGFTSGDTPKNGLSVVVTADDRDKAERVAREVATYAWSQRERFVPRLMTLADATARAVAVGRDTRVGSLLFADVADNPGGGGRGNTTWILEAFHKAGVQGCVVGPFFDAALAAEAHRLGKGARFEAIFNRDETQEFSKRFAAPATVAALGNGEFVGRRGIGKGRLLRLGPSALIDLGGVSVVVGSNRHQASDPGYFEMLGVDLARVRSLVVKSRGHFRAAFDEFFPDARILEVDVPGLTTPVLARVPWKRIPRPIYPLDLDTTWAPA